MSFRLLLQAIDQDDHVEAKRLLTLDPTLADHRVNSVGFNGVNQPILTYAISKEAVTCALHILKHVTNVDEISTGRKSTGYTALAKAIAKACMTRDDSPEQTLFFMLIEKILQRGADPNFVGGSDFPYPTFSEFNYFADRSKTVTKKIAKLLVRYGADPKFIEDTKQRAEFISLADMEDEFLNETIGMELPVVMDEEIETSASSKSYDYPLSALTSDSTISRTIGDDPPGRKQKKPKRQVSRNFESILKRVSANDPTLQRLELEAYGLSDQAIGRLVEAMQSNTHVVHINLCSRSLFNPTAQPSTITAQGVLYLSKLPQLKRLWLNGNTIGDEGMQYLALNLPDLSELYVRNCGLTKDGLELLLRFSVLTNGDFSQPDGMPYQEYESLRIKINQHIEANHCRLDPQYLALTMRRRLESDIRTAIDKDDTNRLQDLIVRLPNGVNTKLEQEEGISQDIAYTPLLYAAEFGRAKCVEYLLRSGANTELHSRRYTPLFHAAENGHLEIVRSLLKYGANITGEFDFNSETALSIAAFKFSNEASIVLGQGPVGPLWQVYSDPQLCISKTQLLAINFLRNQVSLLSVAIEAQRRLEIYTSILNATIMAAAEQDEDDEDTDEEEGEQIFRITPPVAQSAETFPEISRADLQKIVEQLNNEIRQSGIDGVNWSNYPKLFVAHYRGIHFHRNHFKSKQQRKLYRTSSRLGRNLHAPANYQLAHSNFVAPHLVRESELIKARDLTKKAMRKLRQSNPVTAYWNSKFVFENLLYLLKQRHTMDDQRFKSELRAGEEVGMRELAEHGIQASPFCCVSATPEHALRYAYGDKVMMGAKKSGQDFRLRPKFYRTGKPRHPYPGMVFVFLQEAGSLHVDNPLHVPGLHGAGKLNINYRILTEREVSFEASITQGRAFYQETLQIPSFADEYTEDIERRFGLTNRIFMARRSAIAASTADNGDKNRQKVKRMLMGPRGNLIKHKSRDLLSIAEKEARRRGGYLIYAISNTEFSLTPVDITEMQKRHKRRRISSSISGESQHDKTLYSDTASKQTPYSLTTALRQQTPSPKGLLGGGTISPTTSSASVTPKLSLPPPPPPPSAASTVIIDKASQSHVISLPGVIPHVTGTFFSKPAMSVPNLVGIFHSRTIQFEVHQTLGDGRCGVHAMPVPGPERLYDTITDFLSSEDNSIKFPRILRLIGKEIMHGLAGRRVVLPEPMQTKLQQLLARWQCQNDEGALVEYKNLCRTQETCLAYITHDLRINHWIGCGVIMAWAIIQDVNICLWQKTRVKNKISTKDYHISDRSAGVHHILYTNGNHFSLMSEISSRQIAHHPRDRKRKAGDEAVRALEREAQREFKRPKIEPTLHIHQ